MTLAAPKTTLALFTGLRGVSAQRTLFSRLCALNVFNYRRYSQSKLEVTLGRRDYPTFWQFPLDNDIRESRVRLLRDGKFVGDFHIEEAKRLAHNEGLNLILFRPRATPPVCVLARYSEFLEQQRKLRDSAAGAATSPSAAVSNAQTFAFDPSIKVKVVQISDQCAEGDFARKIQGARRFLESGHRVEIVVFAKSSRHKKSVSGVLGPDAARKIESQMESVVTSASAKNVSLSFSLDNPLIQRVDYIYAQLADVGRPFTLRSKVNLSQRQLVLKFWPV